MNRRIFRIVIVCAIVIGLYLFMVKESHTKSFLIISSSITFLIFSFGIHGLIAHSLRPPTSKGQLITYPLLMWLLWAVMFLLFVFVVIPVYYPDFFMDIQ